MKRALSLALIAVLFSGCIHANIGNDEAKRSVRQVLSEERVRLEECQRIDEPPGVLRSLKFVSKRTGKTTTITLERDHELFSDTRNWDANAIESARVASVTTRTK